MFFGTTCNLKCVRFILVIFKSVKMWEQKIRRSCSSSLCRRKVKVLWAFYFTWPEFKMSSDICMVKKDREREKEKEGLLLHNFIKLDLQLWDEMTFENFLSKKIELQLCLFDIEMHASITLELKSATTIIEVNLSWMNYYYQHLWAQLYMDILSFSVKWLCLHSTYYMANTTL